MDYNQKRLSPALSVLLAAERENATLGHENLGFLSASNGFMPKNEPLKSLPKTFSIWDEIRVQTPQLIKDMRFRETIEALPIILPTEDKLEEKYLYRAAMLLGFFAHAYANSAGDLLTQDDVPDCIMLPWKIVSERLGRPTTFLSYFDLIANNWQHKTDGDKSRTIENMELAFPIFDCKEERNLYLIQTEMMATASPMVQATVAAQQAIYEDDHQSLLDSLDTVISCLKHLANVSFAKLAYNKRSKSHLDPVVFTKTMMSFAVPIHESVPGPSGTSFPYAHLIDILLGRIKYDEGISKEALKIRSLYPPHIKSFLQAVSEVSIQDYIQKSGNSLLEEKYLKLVDAYTGDEGFLNTHRKRVYSFVQTSFKVGRPQTIGGFDGDNDEEWIAVDKALSNMRSERPQCPFASKKTPEKITKKAPQNKPLKDPSTGTPVLKLSDVIKHSNEANGYWVIVDNKVLDITNYIKKHPGGEASLKEFVGSDITKEFDRIHEDSLVAKKLVQKFTIGELHQARFSNHTETSLWNAQKELLQSITELYNLYQLETNVQYQQCFPDDEVSDSYAYKKFLRHNSTNRFTTTYKTKLENSATKLTAWMDTHFQDWNQQCPFSQLTKGIRSIRGKKSEKTISIEQQLENLFQLKNKSIYLCECLENKNTNELEDIIKGMLRSISSIDK